MIFCKTTYVDLKELFQMDKLRYGNQFQLEFPKGQFCDHLFYLFKLVTYLTI